MILIDTTPLVALCDPRDSKHRMAVKQLASLVGEPLTTCDAVLTAFRQSARSASYLRKLRRPPRVPFAVMVIALTQPARFLTAKPAASRSVREE